MSVDLFTEGLLPLRKLCDGLPGSRGAERVNPATLWRWALKGIRRRDGQLVKLEHKRIGSKVCSTRPAMERFFAKLSEGDADTPVSPTPTPSAKKRTAERAVEKLDEMLGGRPAACATA